MSQVQVILAATLLAAAMAATAEQAQQVEEQVVAQYEAIFEQQAELLRSYQVGVSE